MGMGKITQVLGAVVDIEFSDSSLPPIYNALKVSNPAISDQQWNLVVEVAPEQTKEVRMSMDK